MLNLYDTATQSVKTLALREPGKVGIYLCGPTVYGPPHLGHGRATLVYDILRRYLTWSGLEVRLVSNITDIDDKIIDRANRENRAWEDITHKCENVWFEAMGKLGVLRPDEVPHATDYVDQMVSMISTLIERDAAYVTGDGVYLNVKSVPDYGLLAHQSLDDMLSGGGDREVLGASNKKNPADFALWKFSKPGEPAWSAPWGDGRPGWHSECVVMSLELLGEGFDLHCGGADLRFPHHENERAQSNALINEEAVGLWVHGEHLLFEGKKMSKSSGNVVLLSDVIKRGIDPLAIRLCFLENKYRSQMDLTWKAIEAADETLKRWRMKMVQWGSDNSISSDSEIELAFNTDLDTSRAIMLMREIEKSESDNKASIFRYADQVLGLDLDRPIEKKVLTSQMQELLEKRSAARTQKRWSDSDQLRIELEKLGLEIQDTPDGQVWS